MTIAVAAVSGKLGARNATAFLAMNTGEPVVRLPRRPEKVRELGIDVRPGDYAQPRPLRVSLEGAGTLLLVSGNTAPADRIGQHRNVIETAKAAGVKKIDDNSVQGAETGAAFSPVVHSNRQTEADVRNRGLDWVIGHDGIHIEPDLEYLAGPRTAERALKPGDMSLVRSPSTQTRKPLAALLSQRAQSPYGYACPSRRVFHRRSWVWSAARVSSGLPMPGQPGPDSDDVPHDVGLRGNDRRPRLCAAVACRVQGTSRDGRLATIRACLRQQHAGYAAASARNKMMIGCWVAARAAHATAAAWCWST